MRIRIRSFIVILFSSLMLAVLSYTPQTYATFNANNLIDDGVFENLNAQNTTSPSAIDAWLNQFPYSCISANSGFRTPDPTGWSASIQTNHGYTFSGAVTAGQALYDAGHIYNVNPQVMITTLQKEQSLISGAAGCYLNGTAPGQACPYAGGCIDIAMGYACPSGCSDSYKGFSLQLIAGTWLLRFAQQRAQGNLIGYAGQDPGDENIHYSGPMTYGYRQRWLGDSSNFYDGTYTTMDGTSVNIGSSATAALYYYTPFIHGNQNFDDIFNGWFGSQYMPVFSAQPIWQSIFTDSSKTTSLGWNATLISGQDAWAVVKIQNTGNVTWTSNGGSNNVRLATYNWGRISPFCAGRWIPTSPNCTRPSGLTETTVVPGGIGTFEFPINAPTGINTYNETFGLVVDGKSTFSSGFINFQFNVLPPIYSAQSVWQQIYNNSNKSTSLGWNASLTTGQNAWAVVVMKNTSNITWTKNGGLYDVRLATYGWGRISPFCAGLWIPTVPNCTRPAGLKENTVPPGATGTFEFNLNAPTGINTYNETFGLVVDGKSTFNSGLMNFQIGVHY